jgi:HIRAN domain
MRKLELSVVGMAYRTTMQFRNHLRSQLPVDCVLVREPHNEHDRNAVMVSLKRGYRQIGYLDRQIAEQFAPLMDSGRIQFIKIALTELEPSEGEGTVTVSFKRMSKKT